MKNTKRPTFVIKVDDGACLAKLLSDKKERRRIEDAVIKCAVNNKPHCFFNSKWFKKKARGVKTGQMVMIDNGTVRLPKRDEEPMGVFYEYPSTARRRKWGYRYLVYFGVMRYWGSPFRSNDPVRTDYGEFLKNRHVKDFGRITFERIKK